MTMKSKPIQKYMKDVIKVSLQMGVKPGTVNHISVYHDDWCGIYRGEDCNCNPIVIPGKPKETRA